MVGLGSRNDWSGQGVISGRGMGLGGWLKCRIEGMGQMVVPGWWLGWGVWLKWHLPNSQKPGKIGEYKLLEC